MIPLLFTLAACGLLPGGEGSDDSETTAAMPSGEVCGNGVDDNANMLSDCADPACASVCSEICSDGFDNDGDGASDCNDSSCDGDCPEDCYDGRDNDGDGDVDCNDGSCDGSCEEACGDDRDNDGDGFVDCLDPSCDGSCPEDCVDGRDNDGDALIDCLDDQCNATCDVDDDGFASADLGGDDCDDGNAAVNPGALEWCNGFDDDCDFAVDDLDPSLDPASTTDWYNDADGDGWGSILIDRSCIPPAGLVATQPGDCGPNPRHQFADPVVHRRRWRWIRWGSPAGLRLRPARRRCGRQRRLRRLGPRHQSVGS